MDRATAVVVGVDFSSCSKTALRQAARVAHWNGASLHVVHVIESLVAMELVDVMGGSSQVVQDQLVQDAQSALKEWISEIDLPTQLKVEVLVGSPLSRLLEVSERVRADVLVLGVFGLSGPATGAGTLATKCARRGSARVLLVNEAHSGPFPTVVAGIDFSATSRAVLEQAIRIAVRDGSALHVVHVFSPPWHRLHYGAPTREVAPDFRAQYRSGLQLRLARCLEEFAEDLKGLRLDVRSQLVESDSHGRGLVSYARQHEAALVVVGTQGRTRLRQVLMGSTGERVLKDTASSVLVVRSSS